MALELFRKIISSSLSTKQLSFSTTSSPPSDQTQLLVTTVVSILKHQRSKSRYTQIQTLYPNGFTPFQFSQIALQLCNNPHLVLTFYNFSTTKSLCTHNLLSYSTLIHILSRARQKARAQSIIRAAIRVSDTGHDLFQTLVKTYRKCDSAPFVFDLLVMVFLEYKKIDVCIDIFRMLMSRGINLNLKTCNCLITCVARNRGVELGYNIYREVFGLDNKERTKLNKMKNGVVPNVQTFNELMLCFYQDGDIGRIEEIWGEMGKLNCVPNGYSYSVLMAAYCDEGKMEECEKLWEEMRMKGIEYDIIAYNTMISGFCRVCEIGKGEELFKEMGLSGIEATCVTYDHLVNGYCQIGDVDLAIKLYEEMSRRGFKAEGSTVNAVIRGLCGKGRALQGLEFLRVGMRNADFWPGGNSYGTLIKGLCQEGLMEEALKLQAEMVGKGFKPDLEIYSAFIDGYAKEGNEEMVGMLKKEMLGSQMQGEEVYTIFRHEDARLTDQSQLNLPVSKTANNLQAAARIDPEYATQVGTNLHKKSAGEVEYHTLERATRK